MAVRISTGLLPAGIPCQMCNSLTWNRRQDQRAGMRKDGVKPRLVSLLFLT
jgi:hypothetical protein